MGCPSYASIQIRFNTSKMTKEQLEYCENHEYLEKSTSSCGDEIEGYYTDIEDFDYISVDNCQAQHKIGVKELGDITQGAVKMHPTLIDHIETHLCCRLEC